MNAVLVIRSLGAILGYLGILVLIPVFFAVLTKEYTSILPFVCASVLAILIGALFSIKKITTDEIDDIKKLDAIAIVFFAWVLFGVLCAIPYLFYGFSPINALFESVSGITSCGSTILTDFSLYPKTFFFFRSLTQWLGGMGIIVMFVAILPKFAIAGRQIFFTEVPGPVDENFTPRVRNSAKWLWTIYFGLTILQIIMLMLIGGLDFYNAVCNALSTVGSGGFSPHPLSTMGYANLKVTWIIILFMFLSGTNFVLLYRVCIQGKVRSILKSEEFRVYFFINLILGLLVAASLYFTSGQAPAKALTDGIYQVLSTTTSTGSCSTDFAAWNMDAKILLFVATFLGGCAASTSGGIKVARWILLFKYLRREIARIIHPKGVYLIKLEQRVVKDDAMSQVMAFIIFYIAIFAISALFVGLIEKNAVIALSGSTATLGSIGPGLASAIGPLGNFDSLHNATKGIFIFNMLVGRLELIPFLAFLHPDMWRKY